MFLECVIFLIHPSRAVGGYVSQTRQSWRRCVQEAQEIFAVPSTASSFPHSQVRGSFTHLQIPHGRCCLTNSPKKNKTLVCVYFNLTDTSLEKRLWTIKKDKPVTSRTTQKRRTKQTKELEVEMAIGGKDASLFLFRALGKILHCKRETHLISCFQILICLWRVKRLSTEYLFVVNRRESWRWWSSRRKLRSCSVISPVSSSQRNVTSGPWGDQMILQQDTNTCLLSVWHSVSVLSLLLSWSLNAHTCPESSSTFTSTRTTWISSRRLRTWTGPASTCLTQTSSLPTGRSVISA